MDDHNEDINNFNLTLSSSFLTATSTTAPSSPRGSLHNDPMADFERNNNGPTPTTSPTSFNLDTQDHSEIVNNPSQFDEYSGNNYTKYLKFLRQHRIYNYNDLCDTICNEYHMKLLSLNYSHNNLKMFIPTEFSEPFVNNNPIIQIIENMIFDITEDIYQPIYLSDYVTKIVPDDIFCFPLNIEHYSFFSTTNMCLFYVFYHEKKWRIISDYHQSLYFLTNKVSYTKIFNECCTSNKFNYKKILCKKYVYLFYVKHRQLISLHCSYNHEIYFYRMYCREKYCNISSLFKDFCTNLESLTTNIFSTKYDFYDIIDPNHHNICEFIIEKTYSDKTRSLCKIATNAYMDLLKFSKYTTNTYEKFLKIKQDTPTNSKEQKQYLEYFRLTKLDKIFKEMICDFYDKYVDTYVNKIDHNNNNSIMNTNIEHKYRILFEIHFIHLQTNKPIFKCDVERIFLYILDQNIIIDSLQQFYAILAPNYMY